MTSSELRRCSGLCRRLASSWPTALTTPASCDWLAERGCEPVIPPNPTRKHPHIYDPVAYRRRNAVERMFCRIKDFRRIATRYDKRADNFLSAVLIAAAVTWWMPIESGA